MGGGGEVAEIGLQPSTCPPLHHMPAPRIQAARGGTVMAHESREPAFGSLMSQ
jgi:hypothetical protein